MPRICTVCAHPSREDIDKALVAGEPSRKIADRYGSLSRAAIQRHGENHLPAILAKAKEAEEFSHADGLLEQVRGLQGITLNILANAESVGDLPVALRAVREVRGNIELLAKLVGQLDESRAVDERLSVQWIELRGSIVAALEDFPEAKESVLLAIEAADDGSRA